MKLISRDDIIDTFLKGKQRGWNFILSKFSFSSHSRTQSAFDESANISSNWWEIPYVKERWNKMISGDKEKNYKEFMMDSLLKDRDGLKLLSLGSGSCSHEIELAGYRNFKKITCVDLAPNRIKEARETAEKKGLTNMEFICSAIDEIGFENNHFDIVLFNSSLHHFKNVDDLLSRKVFDYLNSSGVLIINEYVGPTRLQFQRNQIRKVNEAIRLIPKKYRKRFKSSVYKDKFSGSGIIRMILADPSECIDSENIIPSIHRYYETVVEKPYGGNILMNALKDISHHFIELNAESKVVLDKLFEFEDNYLSQNPSDFIFGVYSKP